MLQQAGWLAVTKLHFPQLRSDLIPRRALLAALRTSVASHALTLLSAPAGYGKTTLLASLAAECPDLHFVWLSLDADDNDPGCFLSGLIAAIQQVNPDCASTPQMLLAQAPDPAAEARRVVGALVNSILECQPDMCLVLDDLHLVTEPAVYDALDYLLDRLPPRAHVVIASRYDPALRLAHLRARGELAELRLNELRFTEGEAYEFLNDRLELGLGDDDLASLLSRTEGWPAGLRLLAGSLAQIPSPAERSAFVLHLAQSERHVFDFLAEEVLARQERDVRSFLLDTSVLPELTPELCQAVTGRADAGALLDGLYRRNLFLTATYSAEGAGGARCYRFHALFADFLSNTLHQEAPGRAAELHLRAAEAYRPAQPAQAIAHYLAAGAWDAAAASIERAGQEALRRGMLDLLQGWIRALPAEVREARPYLGYYLGVCELHRRDLAAAVAHLEQAQAGFELSGDRVGQGGALAYLSQAAFLQADFGRGHLLIGRALAHPVPSDTRVQLLLERARIGLWQGQHASAEDDLRAALDAYEASRRCRVIAVFAGRLYAWPAWHCPVFSTATTGSPGRRPAGSTRPCCGCGWCSQCRRPLSTLTAAAWKKPCVPARKHLPWGNAREACRPGLTGARGRW